METINQFLSHGFTFTGPGYFSEKEIKFNPPFLGTIAKVLPLFAKLPEGFYDPNAEFKRLTFKQRLACAQIAASMATNSRFTSISLIGYFITKIESERLFRLTVMLYHLSDFPTLQEVTNLLAIKK